jgi:hypothetical protein
LQLANTIELRILILRQSKLAGCCNCIWTVNMQSTT